MKEYGDMGMGERYVCEMDMKENECRDEMRYCPKKLEK
jgi:hypothetical protein